MKRLLLIIALLTQTMLFSQDVCTKGICVAEFNASFNETNSVAWLNKLSDCETSRIDIATDANWASKYKIVVVPTLVIFKDGVEVVRYQANIMMQMEATRKDVQDTINELIMESF